MMIWYTWMYVGNTYLNSFQCLLHLLVPDEKGFLFFLTILQFWLPIFIQVAVINLKKDDTPQNIITHKYHTTCVWHTALTPKCTQKFPTIKEDKLNLQHFSQNVLLITDTATGSTDMNWRSIHERARYMPLLHTMTGFWARQPETKRLLWYIPWTESWLFIWAKCYRYCSFFYAHFFVMAVPMYRQQLIPQVALLFAVTRPLPPTLFQV